MKKPGIGTCCSLLITQGFYQLLPQQESPFEQDTRDTHSHTYTHSPPCPSILCMRTRIHTRAHTGKHTLQQHKPVKQPTNQKSKYRTPYHRLHCFAPRTYRLARTRTRIHDKHRPAGLLLMQLRRMQTHTVTCIPAGGLTADVDRWLWVKWARVQLLCWKIAGAAVAPQHVHHTPHIPIYVPPAGISPPLRPPLPPHSTPCGSYAAAAAAVDVVVVVVAAAAAAFRATGPQI